MCQSKAEGGARCFGELKKSWDRAASDLATAKHMQRRVMDEDEAFFQATRKTREAEIAYDKACFDMSGTARGVEVLQQRVARTDQGISADDERKMARQSLQSAKTAREDAARADGSDWDRGWAPLTYRDGDKLVVVNAPSDGTSRFEMTRNDKGKWVGTDGFGRPVGPYADQDEAIQEGVLDDSGSLLSSSCGCDVDRPCNYPPCTEMQENERAHYASMFARGINVPLSQEEWDSVYRDDEGKRMSFETHAVAS